MSEDANVSEEHAREIWRRAAELQADAARKLEERSRALVPVDDDGSNFRLTEVKSAAIEAGISPEFVELALAEAKSDGEKPSLAVEARARKFLGTDQSSIEVSRVIDAPAGTVLDALQRVLPSARYALLHVDTLGDDSPQEGVYVFEPPSMWTQSGAAAEFAQRMGGIGAKRIYVSVRAMDEARTEVAIRAPGTRGLKLNYRIGAGTTGGMGVGGGFGGAGIASGLLGTAALPFAPVIAAGALVGAATVGGLTWWGFRAGYRYGLKKAEKALETLLQVVNASARSRGAFGMPDIPPPTTGPLG